MRKKHPSNLARLKDFVIRELRIPVWSQVPDTLNHYTQRRFEARRVETTFDEATIKTIRTVPAILGTRTEKPTQTTENLHLPRFLRILSPCIMHSGMPLKAKMKVPWRGTPGAHTSCLWPPCFSLSLFLKTLFLLALPLARANFRIICFLYTTPPEGEESFISGVPFIWALLPSFWRDL